MDETSKKCVSELRECLADYRAMLKKCLEQAETMGMDPTQFTSINAKVEAVDKMLDGGLDRLKRTHMTMGAMAALATKIGGDPHNPKPELSNYAVKYVESYLETVPA